MVRRSAAIAFFAGAIVGTVLRNVPLLAIGVAAVTPVVWVAGVLCLSMTT